MPCSTRNFLFSLPLAACFVAGCSSAVDYGDTGKISGRLTMDGTPMEAGTGVTFMEPMKGFLALGLTDAEGNFVVNTFNEGEMPVGKYQVSIAPPDPNTAEWEKLTPEQKFDRPEPKAKRVFPKRYLDLKTSKLEYDVKKGENKFDIDLNSK
jgi:hypothetical protein